MQPIKAGPDFIDPGHLARAAGRRARTLEAAAALRRDARRFAGLGGMIYAECGGFMFLQRAIRLLDGSAAEMVGLFPGVVAMRPRLAAIGYRELSLTLDRRTIAVRGQEFRHSELVEWPAPAIVDGDEVATLAPAGAAAGAGAPAGQLVTWRRVGAGYVHLHLASAPELAELLVARASALRSEHG